MLFSQYLGAVIGSVLGVIIILGIRLSILMFLRFTFFTAFYRTKPGSANIMFTVLEVWNISLTLGFVFIRAIKLVLISLLYVARIDTPFLASGIGRFGPVELDGVSIAFKKDLLIHEAHRHMLIERFGLLCLLKLHAGDSFATRAGSSWRLLFVLITMPWLRKYQRNRNELDIDEQIAELQDRMDDDDSSTREQNELDIMALKSEKSKKIVDTFHTALASEIKILRQRNAYLEDVVDHLKRKNDMKPIKYVDGNDANATYATISFNESNESINIDI